MNIASIYGLCIGPYSFHISFILTDHRLNHETPDSVSMNAVKRAKIFLDYVSMQKQGLAEVFMNSYVKIIIFYFI